MRRRFGLDSGLLFYAPLTLNKNAVYAYNGILTPLVVGDGNISSGRLYINSNASSGFMHWDVPIQGEDITINCYVQPTNVSSNQHNLYHGITGNPLVSYINLFWFRLAGQTVNVVGFHNLDYSTGITHGSNNYFVSIRKIIKGAERRLIVYIDGVKKYENNALSANVLQFNGLQKPSIGTVGYSYTGMGYYKQFSVFKDINDDKVLELFQNNGVPKGF